MPIYSHNKFKGVQPTCTAAVVAAEDRKQAKALLEEALAKRGLSQTIDEKDFVHVSRAAGTVIILADGDY